ncbi:MAG: hypothetical protein JXC85_03305 [Candidatus Aenigmarchaeota archaeon]|nr:hypothetical protein [Candidatus Aenigmarchaeota archaeon]
MDTFIGSLIIIAIVLIILLAVSAYYPYYPEGLPPEMRIIHEFSAGTIGYSDNYVSRSQDYGSFGVGLPQLETLKAVPRMEITAGLFGSASEQFTVYVPEHIVEWLKGGEITFTVEGSNQYGNLMIAWNGDVVYDKKIARGAEAVTLYPGSIKQENTLQVSAQGPGMLFWAATVYNIKDFEVNAEYGPAKFVSFSVSQDELESLDRFDLSWFTASKRGNLVVKVNGEEIFSGVPERQQRVEFTDTGMTTASIIPGTNRLAFMAVNGSYELQDVIMKTYVSKDQRVMKEKFDVTDPQLNSLKAKGGVVRMYVEDIDRTGDLLVKINEQSAGSTYATEGWNSIPFDADLLERGTNWLQISGTGTFDVGDVSVELA